jgi:hypothetical protein
MSRLPVSDSAQEAEEAPSRRLFRSGCRRAACQRVTTVLILWSLLFTLLAGARYYTFRSPIVHDEGVFLYGGMALAAGETTYKDFWDHKPPGVTLFHSVPIRLFGCSLLAVRIHEVFWLAVSATVFFYVCRAHLSLGITFVSLLFYCLLVSTKLLIRSGGLTEESALTFHALCYLFALRRKGSLKLNFFLAGLFLGIAAQFRQPFGVSIVFVVLCLFWRSPDFSVSLRKRLGSLLFLVVGAALPEAATSGYFLLQGIWPEYIEASYLFNFLYMGGGPDVLTLRQGFDKHWQILQATGPYLLSPVLLAPMVWWLPARLRRVAVLAILAFVCDFLALSLGGRYYEHYYLQITISSALILGLTFQAIYEGLRPKAFQRRESELPGAFRRLNSLRAISFALCVLVGSGVLRICALSTADAVKEYRRLYKAELNNSRQPRGELRTERELGKAIQAVTKADERILLFGAAPTSVYFAGQRLAGSRYYHMSPFFRKAFSKSMRPRHRDRFMADLKKRKPVLIILAREERQIYFAGIEVLEKSAASFLVPYVEENYVPLEKLIGLSRIKRDLEWTWYRRACSFLVRKDMAEEIEKRLEDTETDES